MKEIEYVEGLCSKAKKASRTLKSLPSSLKNQILLDLANTLEKRKSEILSANELDLKEGKEKKLSSALMDRLLLNDKRIAAMSFALREIVALPDPVGEVVRGLTLPNGLELTTRRVPLGVVMVIYESRPNVTVDVGALSFKSGNACILRGGSEAFYSNSVLVKLFHEVLQKRNIDPAVITFVDKTDRSFMLPFFQQTSAIDIVVPRGGEALIRFVGEHSKIPVVKHDKGVCNLFIDQDADPEKVIPIVINSKVQRPGVCNATENLILHTGYPFRKELLEALAKEGVELLLDPPSLSLYPKGKPVKEEDYLEEFLDLRLSVKTVSSLEDALAFIEKTSSGHTEAIVTEDISTARIFTSSLDSAALFVNCSTRFHDGGEFGLGAEVGISTGKLHVRGPMGLVHLTTMTTYMIGNGQIRG
ncbi:glutamate-5-semialdehyde dehydrogenase [Leptospira sp. WS92.C1]